MSSSVPIPRWKHSFEKQAKKTSYRQYTTRDQSELLKDLKEAHSKVRGVTEHLLRFHDDRARAGDLSAEQLVHQIEPTVKSLAALEKELVQAYKLVGKIPPEK